MAGDGILKREGVIWLVCCNKQWNWEFGTRL